MDDTTRRVGNRPDDMTGRADETTRNLDTTIGGTAAAPSASTRATSSPRRNTSGTARAASRSATADQGLDGATDERTRELQAEIADTREELSETIEAIQERLRPGNIMSNATDAVKEKARERVRDVAGNAGERASGMMRQSRRTANGVVEHVKQNPVPALMIGAGVAWLLMDRWRHDGEYGRTQERSWSPYAASGRRRYGQHAGGYETNYVEAGTGFDFDDDEPEYSDVDDRTGSTAGGAYTGSMAGRTSHMMEGARDRWQRTTRNTSNGLQRLMRDNPLLVGAAAVLVGAAVGAALPETERENELMGETRDTIVNQAQEMAQNAASTVKEVASNIPSQVTEAVASQVTNTSSRGE